MAHTNINTCMLTYRPASSRLYFSIWSQATALVKALRAKLGNMTVDDVHEKSVEIFATFDRDGSGNIGMCVYVCVCVCVYVCMYVCMYVFDRDGYDNIGVCIYVCIWVHT